MFYNLAGCPLKPRGTGSLAEGLATIDDTGRRDICNGRRYKTCLGGSTTSRSMTE
ncbi:hypothetical protein [Cupriavidus taiwanensis]|uniref:hypothetical protein n=1 Tax=Cupriavidus taiwanensis TaxID=164546 RepID=UPI0015F256A5|nr:hypothetical protein [Cupriavidus taiwanensis]